MSRFANLADKPKVKPKPEPQSAAPSHEQGVAATASVSNPSRSNSRAGRKACQSALNIDPLIGV